VIDRYSVRTFRQMAAASLAYALVTEGIITPVIYGDGPLPVLAVYFAGWHSGLAVLFLWYGVRRLALRSQRARLAWSALVVGVAWGLWSTVYWRASAIADMRREAAAGEAVWDAGQWPTGKFAVHAFAVTAAVILAHRLLGGVWQERFATTRRWVRVVVVLLLAGLGVMTVVVFFAPLKLAALAWVVLRLVRARPTEQIGPGLLAQMTGQVLLADLVPLLIMPAAAVGAYGSMAAVDPSDSALGVGVAVTLLAGVLVIVSASRSRGPRANGSPGAEGSLPQNPRSPGRSAGQRSGPETSVQGQRFPGQFGGGMA
jgi:hypothetical protein